jgi:hypothetical protein
MVVVSPRRFLHRHGVIDYINPIGLQGDVNSQSITAFSGPLKTFT